MNNSPFGFAAIELCEPRLNDAIQRYDALLKCFPAKEVGKSLELRFRKHGVVKHHLVAFVAQEAATPFFAYAHLLPCCIRDLCELLTRPIAAYVAVVCLRFCCQVMSVIRQWQLLFASAVICRVVLQCLPAKETGGWKVIHGCPRFNTLQGAL